MELLCIDPGPVTSGVVYYDGQVVSKPSPNLRNSHVVDLIQQDNTITHCVIEGIACYGMPVGKDVFETCIWVGQFMQALKSAGCGHDIVYRKDIKLYLCNSLRAKDSNIRRAILDKFPPTGGGKTPQIGTKKQPGPLYGVTSHAMSALAVGITWFERYLQKGR